MRKVALALAAVSLAALVSGCSKLSARNELNHGVQEFTATHFNQAVDHFKEAVRLDPGLVAARNYLAIAYMQQYIPGSDSPDNNKMAQAALDNFQEVLKMEPSNTVAIASIASLYLNQKKWDEAQQWYEKLVAVDPKNADAYYSMGFIAWSKWYVAYTKGRADANMKQEDPGPIKDKKIREGLKAQWSQTIDNGLASLDKALQIDPEYEDAMAYENLLVRERADLADSKEDYEKGIKAANDWVDKALETKKKKAEKKNKQTPQGIVAQ